MYIDPWATYVWNEMLLLCSWNIAITKWKASIHGNKKIILTTLFSVQTPPRTGRSVLDIDNTLEMYLSYIEAWSMC